MKEINTTLFLTLLCFTLFAQSTSPEIISTTGEVYNGTNIQLDWTIGELVIETIEHSNDKLTQGFHQPEYLITAVNELPPNLASVRIYPNPTRDNLHIDMELEKNNEVQIQLVDMVGKVLWEKNVIGKSIKEEKEMDPLPSGIYIVKLLIGNHSQNFKISKIN